MLTDQEFVERWKFELAGIALYGQTMNYNEIPLNERTKHAMGVPKLVESLLRRMHADLVPASPAEATVPRQHSHPPVNRVPTTNGVNHQTKR